MLSNNLHATKLATAVSDNCGVDTHNYGHNPEIFLKTVEAICILSEQNMRMVHMYAKLKKIVQPDSNSAYEALQTITKKLKFNGQNFGENE